MSVLNFPRGVHCCSDLSTVCFMNEFLLTSYWDSTLKARVILNEIQVCKKNK